MAKHHVKSAEKTTGSARTGASAPKSKNTKRRKKTAKSIQKSRRPAEDSSLHTAYLLNGGDGAVTLEIIIGAPGQSGTSDILLDNVSLVAAKKGSIPEFAIGTNKKLGGKTLYITTIVSDTSHDTNYCESIIRLRGGVRFAEYHLFKTVSQEGEAAIFSSVIDFFNI